MANINFFLFKLYIAWYNIVLIRNIYFLKNNSFTIENIINYAYIAILYISL